MACARCSFHGQVPNYQFSYTLDNGQVWEITFTAVRGHLMSHDFPPECKSWRGYPTRHLFDVDVIRSVNAVRSYFSADL